MSRPVIVVGPGHNHNEFLSWVINRSGKADQSNKVTWELYPGPFGTFIRHDDDWNVLQYHQYRELYNKKYRNAPAEKQHRATREQLTGLLAEIEKLPNKFVLSQYINAVNVDEVAEWCRELGVPVATAIINLPETPFRSHYAQMEFSPGAAEAKDYSEDAMFKLESVCYWLQKKHRQQEEIKQFGSVHKANVNQMLQGNMEVIDILYRSLNIEPTANPDVLQREIEYFCYINQAQHHLMRRVNRLSWEQINSIAKG